MADFTLFILCLLFALSLLALAFYSCLRVGAKADAKIEKMYKKEKEKQ